MNFPAESNFASDKRAVLSRRGVVPEKGQVPGPPENNWNTTSIVWSFNPEREIDWPCVGDKKQKVSVSLVGSSRATTLERPGGFPIMTGSPGTGVRGVVGAMGVRGVAGATGVTEATESSGIEGIGSSLALIGRGSKYPVKISSVNVVISPGAWPKAGL